MQKINRYELENIINRKILGSFLYMGLGLFITFGIALFVSSSANSLNFITNNLKLILILQVVSVLAISFLINKLNKVLLMALFLTYSALTGLSFSILFVIYSKTSISGILLATISIFLVLALYGYYTKENILKLGGFLFAGLIGVIVLSLVNIFIKSSGLEMILSFVALFIFIIYVAYDVQKIKKETTELVLSGREDILDKVQIIGALSLYMDFINIFIRLVSLFGNKD